MRSYTTTTTKTPSALAANLVEKELKREEKKTLCQRLCPDLSPSSVARRNVGLFSMGRDNATRPSFLQQSETQGNSNWRK